MYWHEEKKERLHSVVVELGHKLKHQWSSRHQQYARYASLYTGRRVDGFDPGQWNYDSYAENPPPTFNLASSAVNTITSLVTAKKPSPQVLTNLGDEDAQERAKGLEHLIKGVLRSRYAFKQMRRMVRDACIYGIGFVKVWPGEGRVDVQRVHPTRVYWDDAACVNGNQPLTILEQRWMTREEMEEVFLTPSLSKKERTDLKAVISSCKSVTRSSTHYVQEVCEVWEAFRVKRGERPGRHSICADSGVLFDEEWNETEHCYIEHRWQDAIEGWGGIGICEEIEGLQLESNDTMTDLAQNRQLLSVLYLLVNRNSKIDDNEILSNLPARKVEYNGTEPPTVVAPPMAHPQMMEWPNTLKKDGYDQLGLSMMNATGNHPQGLRSGLALMTHNDNQTRRFADFENGWQESNTRVGEQIIRAGRRVKGWKVNVRVKDMMKRIALSRVDMADDRFTIGVYPASALPDSPAGRSEYAINMTQVGILQPQEARQLLEFGDLDKYQQLANAEIDSFEMIFEEMLKGGTFVPPIEFQDLKLGLDLAARYYARAYIEKRDPKNIAKITQWMQQASELLNPEINAPPQPAGPPNGQPAPPEAPQPTLPNEPVAPSVL